MVRYHPQWLRARSLVRSGRIGALRAMQGFFSYNNRDPENIRNIAEIGGGGLYDHRLLPDHRARRFLFDAEPTRVVSLIERDPDWGIDSSDLSDARLSGRARHLHLLDPDHPVPAHSGPRHEGANRDRDSVQRPAGQALPDFLDDGSQLGNAGVRVEEFPVTDQYAAQGNVFSKSVRTGAPLEFPLENAVQGMRIIDAIFRSAQSGGWETP